MESDFKNLIKFFIADALFKDVFQIFDLQRNNFHSVNELVVVSSIVISLIFSSSEIGDDVEI